MSEPSNAEEIQAYLKESADLIFNIGTILEDRGIYGSEEEDEFEYAEREYALWRYLYDNQDALYERIGPIIDEIEDHVAGEWI